MMGRLPARARVGGVVSRTDIPSVRIESGQGVHGINYKDEYERRVSVMGTILIIGSLTQKSVGVWTIIQ